jgi:hypothetical protein
MNTYSETTIVTRDLCASGTDVPRALTAEPQTGKVGNDQPCTSTEIIARGRASLAHIERGHWPDWRNVIAALAAGRTIALLQAGTNVPQGGRYREAMGRWLRCHGFDRIDKADRSRLLKVADNLTAIDEWRNGLPPDEQLRLNHPRTVLATWNATQRQSSPPPPPPPPPAGANARDDVGPESLGEIARMRARNEELEAETARIARTNLTLGNEIDRLEVLLAGPYGEPVRELITFLRTMSLDEGPQLIELVRASDWHRTDPDTRSEILSLINAALMTLREQHGLLPFDDALPDEEPTAFLIIREMFR